MIHYPTSLGDIYLGASSSAIRDLLNQIPHSGRFVITDTHTHAHCLPLLQGLDQPHHTILLPPGEKNKDLVQCQRIWSHLIEHGADRETLIINLGGGVICDLGGFAAACYQRGVRFVHFPTTVTAMTDAAIGGKLAVDFQGYKNYIGLFRAPELIWINPDFIRTLPKEEIHFGLAEVVKHAIIGSPSLWENLGATRAIEDIDWEALLALSIEVKIRVTEEDPLEKGLRKTLNFGHTIGHALESYYLTTDHPLTHGQAVTLGILAESRMAQQYGLLDSSVFEAITEMVFRLLAPPVMTIPTLASLENWLIRDKKSRHGEVMYSLPQAIGSCRWNIANISPEEALLWLGEQVSPHSHRFRNNHP